MRDSDKTQGKQHYETLIREDLVSIVESAYRPNGFACWDIVGEAESTDYGAFRTTLNQRSVLFRTAKITPTKTGQFVVVWKRQGSGPIMPFDCADGFQLFIVTTRSGGRLGQFIFPAAVMARHGILSRDGFGGKRGMRVYPPWDIATNKQASKTQSWQLEHFLDLSDVDAIDTARLAMLLRA